MKIKTTETPLTELCRLHALRLEAIRLGNGINVDATDDDILEACEAQVEALESARWPLSVDDGCLLSDLSGTIYVARKNNERLSELARRANSQALRLCPWDSFDFSLESLRAVIDYLTSAGAAMPVIERTADLDISTPDLSVAALMDVVKSTTAK